jgi:uncharacterized protein YbcI
METNMPHQTRPGTDLGERFLAPWEQANGLTNSQAQVLPGDNCLVVIIEGALTQDERLLAKKEKSENPLRQYLDGLMHVISEEALQVPENNIDRSVASAGTDYNFAQGCVRWYFKLKR